MSKFFEKFYFLCDFLKLTGEKQEDIEQQLKANYTKDDKKLSKFLGDTKGEITLLLWLGRKYGIAEEKACKKKEEKTFNKIKNIVYTSEEPPPTSQDSEESIEEDQEFSTFTSDILAEIEPNELKAKDPLIYKNPNASTKKKTKMKNKAKHTIISAPDDAVLHQTRSQSQKMNTS